MIPDEGTVTSPQLDSFEYRISRGIGKDEKLEEFLSYVGQHIAEIQLLTNGTLFQA